MLVRNGDRAKVGSASLEVRVLRRSSAGAVSSLAPERLREAELYGPVTGTLAGTFRAAAWVRGRGRTVGKNVRLQLNEFGGVRAEEPLEGASRAIRLTRRWRRVTVQGSVRRNDRTGVAALVFLDRGQRGDLFYADDYRVFGTPLLRAPPTTASDRWAWWNYALVWTAVLASGAAWLVYSRRPAGKTT